MLAGRERVLEVEHRVAAVLDLPQRLEVPQQDVTEPLRVHTRDPPLLGFLVLQPAGPWWSEKKQNNLYCKEIGKIAISDNKPKMPLFLYWSIICFNCDRGDTLKNAFVLRVRISQRRISAANRIFRPGFKFSLLQRFRTTILKKLFYLWMI